ncbi:MAG: hypothetical protein ACJ79S_18665 [Gemmatimonadaceae bacterium]
MPHRFVRNAAAAAVLATALGAGSATVASPLLAQGGAPRTAPIAQITPYAGYMFFGDFLKGPIGTSISSANGPLYGAQLGVNLTRNVALIGNVARASGDLQVGVPFLGGLSVGQSSAWLYDGGIQLSAPLGARAALPITPFVQLGAGAISYDVNASVLETKATNFAANAGVGVDVGFGGGVALRLLAKDYVGRFDVKQATSLGGVNGDLSHNIGVSAGVKLEF